VALSLVVVDTFTTEPFHGNPAAVTILDPSVRLSDQQMQEIAREMALSETAFLRPRGLSRDRPGSGSCEYDLRWFTPLLEVDLCGHATLASAHVVGTPVTFHTRSGRLRCENDAAGLIVMDLPKDPVEEVDPPIGMVPAARAWMRGRSDLLAELASAAEVRRFEADMTSIASLPCRGLIVTGPGDRGGVDCVSRFFAPQSGIPEDPVTGSAHCTIAEVWSRHLGKSQLVGEQASSRGGTVHMSVGDDRVAIGGRAVTVSEVHLLV
jgi:predicted PhzF superfamily epimerase YddE/YHI9